MTYATLLCHVKLCHENGSFGGREARCWNDVIHLINDVESILLLCNSSMSTVCSMGVLGLCTDGYFPISVLFLMSKWIGNPRRRCQSPYNSLDGFYAISHCFILCVYFGHPLFNGIPIRMAALSFVHMDLFVC